jgi:integrase
MKLALTAVGVARLKPPAQGQADYFDKGFPGLSLRISYSGRKTWTFLYRRAGKARRMNLGLYPAMGLAEARDAWRQARQGVQAGHDPQRAKAPTEFAAVAAEWLERDQSENRTVKEAQRILDRYVMPKWEGLSIEDIGRRDVRELIDSIADRGTPIMARRVYGRLHRLFTWAVQRDIITSSPMVGLPKPGSENERERVLTDDELAAVWRNCETIGFPYGNAIRLLILTGARRTEVGALAWPEIVGDQIRLEGGRTKMGKPHTMPLSAPAVAILDEIPRVDDCHYVFLTPLSGWSKAKAKLDELSSVTDWRLHDLRRTVATGLQKLGFNLQTIEAVLGHTSGSRSGVVGIYQRHSFDAEKRSALEAWGAHVMALVEGEKPGKVVAMPRAR